MTIENMSNKKEFTLEDHIKEREAKSPSFAEARARHRERFEYTKKLIEARLAHKLTQKELAEALGTTQSAVARLEGGKFLPSAETLHRLAEVLEIEICIGPKKLDIKPLVPHVSSRLQHA